MRTAIIAIVLMTILLAACAEVRSPIKTPITASLPADSGLKKFSSASDVQEFLQKTTTAQGSRYGGMMYAERSAMAIAKTSASAVPAPMMEADSGTGSDGSATDYSQTNVQVEGVDEADIIKNDGKYIYLVSGNSVLVIDGYPAKDAKTLSTLTFKGTPRNLFIKDNKLIVLVDGSMEVTRIYEGDFVPRPYYTQTAQVFVYDVSDHEAPKKSQNYSIEGYYFESRLIGDDLYFIVQNPVDYYGGPPIMPFIRGSKMLAPDVYYFDHPDYSYSFYTIGSLNVNDGPSSLNAESYMLGQSVTLYSSEKAIYLAARQSPGWTWYRESNMKKFREAVLPALPALARSRIEAIGSDAKWADIASIMEDMYNSMSEDEQDALVEKIENSINDYERKLQIELSKTTLHKLAIDNGDITYAGKGTVSGYPLNQFSMDEFEGNLRIATTTEFWTSQESVMHNNVYVLDSSMNVVGSLQNLAKDERIYSARFIGDRLYLVTFQRIDPLFVIDLSTPSSPEVLGELKIPGYSDYLHPYDENHIIGIGKDTKENEWGGVSTAGIKMALFDVSDVTKPKQVADFHIGKAGSDSEALRDHKAFLFDKKKNILVLPVTEVKDSGTYDPRYGYYRQRTWQGAYVFGVDPSSGFTVKGKVQHYEGEEASNWWWYGSPHAIRRSLYMDDALYTLSGSYLKANDLNSLSSELVSITLPNQYDDYGYPRPMPMDVVVTAAGSASAPAMPVEDVK